MSSDEAHDGGVRIKRFSYAGCLYFLQVNVVILYAIKSRVQFPS